MEWYYLLMYSLLSIFYCIVQIITIFLLVYEKQKGVITIADFALVLSLNNIIISILWSNFMQLSNFSKLIGETQHALNNIFSNVKAKNEETTEKFVFNEGKINFENVTFGYEKNEKPLFKDFSLRIKAKEKVGIVERVEN